MKRGLFHLLLPITMFGYYYLIGIKMKKILFLPLPLILISCSGQSCEISSIDRSNYQTAINSIESNDFTIEDEISSFDNDSSWITDADFYSCDKDFGFLILEFKGKDYLFENVPTDVWFDFKNSSSKGKFYHRNIKGNYRFKLRR